MLIRRNRGWELRESEATSEGVFFRRRELVKAIAAGPILASALGSALAAVAEDDPSASLYPAKRNPRYTLDRSLTEEKLATTYNNFYEFGSQKTIAAEAQQLMIRPWTVRIDGLVGFLGHLVVPSHDHEAAIAEFAALTGRYDLAGRWIDEFDLDMR